MNGRLILGGLLACVVGGAMVAVGGVDLRNHVPGYLDDHYRRVAPGRWDCGADDPIAVGRRLGDDLPPDAYAEDSGRVYLRHEDLLTEVGAAGGRCSVDSGDRRPEISAGRYRHLGPGFGPSSPASSSGGSAGGFGGAK